MGAHAANPSGPLGPAVLSNLERAVEGQSSPSGLPALWTNVGLLIEQLKAAYRSTTKGAFGEALDTFVSLLHMLVFVVAPTKQARTEVEELRDLCREYIMGLRMELHKKTLPAQNQVEGLELAAYFTHCNLQPIHRMLALRSAMKAAYRIKCFHLAASFASRLLELSPKPEIAQEAKKVIKFAETNNTDAHNLNYDERNPFVVCGISFTPIYKNRPSIECPYCHTHYLPAHAGKLCPACQLAEIGKDSAGIKFTPGRD
jgi:coatomer protein complex subunit alpha (xenin)